MTRTTPLKVLTVCGLLILPLGLSGCVGTMVGAGATAATAAAQERGFSGAVDDTVIRTRINALWLDHNEEMFRKAGLQVHEGRALLTGTMPTQQMRLDAVRLAWQADGVREVINEMTVAKSGGVSGFATDTWISTQLKTRILFDKEISSINYSIETVAGVVYLMGIAQTQDELARVTTHARSISNVRQVVSYVRLKDDPDRKAT